MGHAARSSMLALLMLTLVVPTTASAKRKKEPKVEEPPPTVPATFQVYGLLVQDQALYSFGTKLECDLTVYVVDGGAPVTDAVVTVAGQALPHDTYFEGRYRLQQSCVDEGTPLAVTVVRGNQRYDQQFGTMPGYPAIEAPSRGEQVATSGDLDVRWAAAPGAVQYTVSIEGVDDRWSTTDASLAVPAAAVPPYRHHKLTLTSYASAVDLDAAERPLTNAEPVWPGLTALTRVNGEFDFGPWLVDQNWAGDAVIQWWEDDKTLDEDLFKVWLLLSPDGSYAINRVKIGVFELAMYESREIEWDPYDLGDFRIGEDGELLLESSLVDGLTWSGTYAAPELTLLKIRAETDDADEKRRRRFEGAPKPWTLTVQDIEASEF